MKKKWKTGRIDKGISLLLSIILVFSVLGAVVFSVSRKITKEMSESAVQNLSESLDLIKGTLEAILQKEAEFQLLIAREIAAKEDPKEFIRSYNKNRTMVKLSLVMEGETEGISNTGDVFTEEGLDFSAGETVDELPISKSYLNYMGTWAYTMKCPVERDGQRIAWLYVEYIYDSFEKSLPVGFYNGRALYHGRTQRAFRAETQRRGRTRCRPSQSGGFLLCKQNHGGKYSGRSCRVCQKQPEYTVLP